MPRIRNSCPPGIICITPSVIAIICVIITFFLLFYVFVIQKQHTEIPLSMQTKYLEKAMEKHELQQQQQQQQQQPSVQVKVGDSRYSRAPKPTRDWLNSSIDLDGSIYAVPRIATQGLPEAYQSMGIVKTESGELLPLYGRRIASRSDRFNYYTRTDTNNPLPLPITYKKRDCQDNVGCDELFDGDQVTIIPTKQNGSVTVYRFNGPTYIPGLI